MSRIIDISLPIGPRLLTWPGDPAIQVRSSSRIADGDSANVSELHFGTHTGTHVDPPLHFIADGAGVDELPLEVLIGEAEVVDLTGVPGPIEVSDLSAVSAESERLLLKTDNSGLWAEMPETFPESFVSLAPGGADWIVEAGIKLVGCDFLGIEAKGSPGHPTHLALLKAGVVIVEGLDLSAVEPGTYRLVCLPLRIDGGDGGPARAVLLED